MRNRSELDSGDFFHGGCIAQGIDKHLQWVLSGLLCDVVEGSLEGFHGTHFFAGVVSGSHEFVDVALNNGEFGLAKPGVGVSSTAVGNANRTEIDVGGQSGVDAGHLRGIPLAEHLRSDTGDWLHLFFFVHFCVAHLAHLSGLAFLFGLEPFRQGTRR